MAFQIKVPGYKPYAGIFPGTAEAQADAYSKYPQAMAVVVICLRGRHE